MSRDGPKRHHRPALLAAIQAATGAFTAVEVTYLAAHGGRAADAGCVAPAVVIHEWHLHPPLRRQEVVRVVIHSRA